jgi:hypothetical protein
LAVIAVVYSLVLGSAIRYPDERDYLALAQNLAKHGTYTIDGVHPTAFRVPGYPFPLAALRLFSLPLAALRLLDFAAWGVVVWAGWWLARRIGGSLAATIAAPLIALYPLGIYTAGAFYPQAFGAMLMMVALVLVAELPGSPRPLLLAAAAGFVFGALVLTLPTFVYVLVLAAVWLGLRRVRPAALAALVVAAALLPAAWTVRNALTMHAFVPLSTNGGLNLLLGYSPHSGIRTGADIDIERYTEHVAARHLNEVQADHYFLRSALHWIGAHPGKAAELYAGKNLDYFAPFDTLEIVEQNTVGKRVLAAVSYLPLLALFVLRLVFWRRFPPGSLEKLLIAIYLAGAPVAAVFFTRVRFRVPADPLMLVVAAGFVAAWLAARPSAAARRPRARRSASARPS